MFDTLNFYDSISKTVATHLLEDTNLFKKSSKHLLENSTIVTSNIRNYKVSLIHNILTDCYKLKFVGSVAKFQKDENFTDLTKSDLLEFVSYLEDAIQINVNTFKINRIDLSLNISNVLSENVFEVLGTLKSAKKATNDNSITYNSKACQIYIYNKLQETRQNRAKNAKEKSFVQDAEELTKYEHRLLNTTQIKRLFKHGLMVQDLQDDSVIQSLSNTLISTYNAIEKISKYEIDFSNLSSAKDFETMLILTKYSYSEIEKLIEKAKKDRCFKRVATYSEIKSKYKKLFKENKFEKVENETLKTLDTYFENLPTLLKKLGF